MLLKTWALPCLWQSFLQLSRFLFPVPTASPRCRPCISSALPVSHAEGSVPREYPACASSVTSQLLVIHHGVVPVLVGHTLIHHPQRCVKSFRRCSDACTLSGAGCSWFSSCRSESERGCGGALWRCALCVNSSTVVPHWAVNCLSSKHPACVCVCTMLHSCKTSSTQF